NRMDGVTATVNYASEKAQVAVAEGSGVATADLIATVERTGYTAAVPEPPAAAPSPDEDSAARPADEDALAPLLRRLLVSLALSVPVVLMAMVPPLQFTNWQWLSLTLAAPVVAYG